VGDRNRSVAEMTAETLREIAVLSAVFFMLDNLMKDNPAQVFPLNVTLYVLIGCIVVYSLGIIIEKVRPLV
jgi:predicted membrane channel-forming protein YqfA (hemolysin III family)